jgi:hypothetical protein
MTTELGCTSGSSKLVGDLGHDELHRQGCTVSVINSVSRKSFFCPFE